MRERSLVAFTLLAQTAVGMFCTVAGVWWVTGGETGMAPGSASPDLAPLVAVGPLVVVAAAVSLLHLGTPRNAWRALANLKRSWLSREILFLGLFGVGWIAVVAAGLATEAEGGAAVFRVLAAVVAVLGVGLLYSMSRVYRLRTVPAWDTPLTPVSFFLTAGSLGGPAAALAIAVATGTSGASRADLLLAAACLAVELALEPAWRAHRSRAAARVDPGLYPARTAGLAGPTLRPTFLLIALACSLSAVAGVGRSALIAAALVGSLAAAVLGRAAFYASYARRGL
jgi:DMSO reductase anchor subunit